MSNHVLRLQIMQIQPPSAYADKLTSLYTRKCAGTRPRQGSYAGDINDIIRVHACIDILYIVLQQHHYYMTSE